MLNLQTYIDQEIITKYFKSTIPEEYAGYYLERLLEASKEQDPYISDYFLLQSLDIENGLPKSLQDKGLNPENICITKFTYKSSLDEKGNTIFDLTNPNHNLEILKSYIEQEWAYIWDLNIIDQAYQIFEYDKEAKTLTLYLVALL